MKVASPAGYRPALVLTYQKARLWIVIAGILTGAGIAVLLRWPYGWWISVGAVPELLHALNQRRRHRRDVLASLLTTATVIGVIGLIVRLPSYAGTSLAFMAVAAVALLPPRRFAVVIGYQTAWTAAIIWLYAEAGVLPMNPGQELWLHVLGIGFFTVSTFMLLWVVMRELDLLDQLRNHLLGTVSHELRTPLTGVVGIGRLLQEQGDQFDPATKAELVDLIVQGGSEATAIVEDLLTAVRSAAGALEVTPEVFSVAEEVGRSHTVLPPELRRSIAITGDQSATAWADPTRFRQIIRNLLSNAQRYGGDLVTVSIGCENDTVRVVVADDGHGIPQAEWETVFEPFGRATGARRNTDSVGLGLPISRALARTMGGDLTYRYQNQESLFNLSLPASPPTEAPDDAQRVIPEPSLRSFANPA